MPTSRRKSRFPSRHHAHIDASCELDSEDLGAAPRLEEFDYQLEIAMRDHSLDDLHKHYPELIFTRVPSTGKNRQKKEKGHDFYAEHFGLHTYADWRTSRTT